MLARSGSLAGRPLRVLKGCRAARRAEACGQMCGAEQFRAFLETVDRRLSLFRPGAAAVSPDEHWLLRLTAALSRRDVPAAAALIAFRVERPRRREALAQADVIAVCLESLAHGLDRIK